MRFALVLILFLQLGCIGIPTHSKTKAKPLPDSLDVDHVWVDIPVDEETTLRGIWADNGGPGVLLLSGSGQGIAGVAQLIQMLHDAGYAVLCCDYRGTGYSTGDYGTSRYLDDDALVLWRWLREQKGRRAGVIGISIGAVAATPLVRAPDPPAAIVLDRLIDPDTVVRRFMEANLGPMSGEISTLVVHNTIDVKVKRDLSRARTDVLVLLPQQDVLCPATDAWMLLETRAASVSVTVLPGGHLNSHLVDPRWYRKELLGFLDARLRPGRPALGGRAVTPDPARVSHATFDGRWLEVEFAPGPLPNPLTLLVMGDKANTLIPVPEPRRRLRFWFSRQQRTRLGNLFWVRVVPADFLPTVGTRTYLKRAEPMRK